MLDLATTPPATAVPTPISGRLSAALDKRRSFTLAGGTTLHRPSPDAEEGATAFAPASYCTQAEHLALARAAKPLAELESQQRAIEEAERAVRFGPDTSKRADLPKITAEAERLKAEHAVQRGATRAAYLAALDAATCRAGHEYQAAVGVVADAAAKYEGLRRHRDELIGRPSFDPLGLWTRTSRLLAPDVEHRAPGWCTTAVYGADVLWFPETASHANAVREARAAFDAEMLPALVGARFPF